MKLEDILDTLMKDMIKNKVVPEGTTVDSYKKYDLSRLLLDTYMNYPLPPKSSAFFPYNYCMMSETWTIAQNNKFVKKMFQTMESILCESELSKRDDF